MDRGDFPLLEKSGNSFHHKGGGHHSHNFHGLADCDQRGAAQTGCGDFAEANDGHCPGTWMPDLRRARIAPKALISSSERCSERASGSDELFGWFAAALEA
jgi:hypothetical protein